MTKLMLTRKIKKIVLYFFQSTLLNVAPVVTSCVTQLFTRQTTDFGKISYKHRPKRATKNLFSQRLFLDILSDGCIVNP